MFSVKTPTPNLMLSLNEVTDHNMMTPPVDHGQSPPLGGSHPAQGQATLPHPGRGETGTNWDDNLGSTLGVEEHSPTTVYPNNNMGDLTILNNLANSSYDWTTYTESNRWGDTM